MINNTQESSNQHGIKETGENSEFNPSLDLRRYNSRDEEVDKTAQYFYGHGKLLLTGEYFVLDGAMALGLPVQVGQSLSVRYSQSFRPRLSWKSFDVRGKLWLESLFEFWRFDCLDENPSKETLMLQKVLRQVRRQNSHFLRDDVDVLVETRLGFPLDWGLGSSSTFIYNVAKWAYVSPFELLFETYGGSGYDIACAQSEGPIVYQRDEMGINWKPISFHPSFSNNLYFVFLGKKQDSRQALDKYNNFKNVSGCHTIEKTIQELSHLTEKILSAKSLGEFEHLIRIHEKTIANELKMTMVKDSLFSDYWGEVKSLGAWGGDFTLVTSDRSQKETMEYFQSKGYSVILSYDELILDLYKDDKTCNLTSFNKDGLENDTFH